MTTTDIITQEIVELHDFFTAWFTGTADRADLTPRFLSHMADNLTFISPDGVTLTKPMFKTAFDQSHGSNPNLRITVEDVAIQLQQDDLVLATYTERQAGLRGGAPDTARLSSALIRLTAPPTWLHIHETWLPQAT